MISILVAHRNDRFLVNTLTALSIGVNKDDFEVIVYDDCSDLPLSLPVIENLNIRVIQGSSPKGVGHAFDTCVKQAKGDKLVIMGSDVIVKDPSWIDTVNNFCDNYPKSIGCFTCLSLDPTHLNPLEPANDVKRYGATLLPIATSDTLPSDSPALEGTSQYVVDLLQGRWFKTRPTEAFNEIPCLMGALYTCTKEWYSYIGGWDNSHLSWGCVEPWISIKSWLMGGSVINIRDAEAGHIWHKYESPANGRSDRKWYNCMFVAYSQLPMDVAKRMIDKVYDMRVQYELHTLPFNLGKKLLRERWSRVMEVRERNTSLFLHDWNWYCDKFNIKEI